MVQPPASRSFRIRFLLWLADVVYNANVRWFSFTGLILNRLADFFLRRYSSVASWCWVQLMRHATEEEALVVGNRRLLPLGLELQRKPLPQATTENPNWAEGVWAGTHPKTPSEMN